MCCTSLVFNCVKQKSTWVPRHSKEDRFVMLCYDVTLYSDQLITHTYMNTYMLYKYKNIYILKWEGELPMKPDIILLISAYYILQILNTICYQVCFHCKNWWIDY